MDFQENPPDCLTCVEHLRSISQLHQENAALRVHCAGAEVRAQSAERRAENAESRVTDLSNEVRIYADSQFEPEQHRIEQIKHLEQRNEELEEALDIQKRCTDDLAASIEAEHQQSNSAMQAVSYVKFMKLKNERLNEDTKRKEQQCAEYREKIAGQMQEIEDLKMSLDASLAAGGKKARQPAVLAKNLRSPSREELSAPETDSQISLERSNRHIQTPTSLQFGGSSRTVHYSGPDYDDLYGSGDSPKQGPEKGGLFGPTNSASLAPNPGPGSTMPLTDTQSMPESVPLAGEESYSSTQTTPKPIVSLGPRLSQGPARSQTFKKDDVLGHSDRESDSAGSVLASYRHSDAQASAEESVSMGQSKKGKKRTLSRQNSIEIRFDPQAVDSAYSQRIDDRFKDEPDSMRPVKKQKMLQQAAAVVPKEAGAKGECQLLSLGSEKTRELEKDHLPVFLRPPTQDKSGSALQASSDAEGVLAFQDYVTQRPATQGREANEKRVREELELELAKREAADEAKRRDERWARYALVQQKRAENAKAKQDADAAAEKAKLEAEAVEKAKRDAAAATEKARRNAVVGKARAARQGSA